MDEALTKGPPIQKEVRLYCLYCLEVGKLGKAAHMGSFIF